jgi:hypothetical protein
MHEFNITLFRDSLSTPWGIRLEGGREFGTPLTIQRVSIRKFKKTQYKL